MDIRRRTPHRLAATTGPDPRSTSALVIGARRPGVDPRPQPDVRRSPGCCPQKPSIRQPSPPINFHDLFSEFRERANHRANLILHSPAREADTGGMDGDDLLPKPTRGQAESSRGSRHLGSGGPPCGRRAGNRRRCILADRGERRARATARRDTQGRLRVRTVARIREAAPAPERRAAGGRSSPA